MVDPLKRQALEALSRGHSLFARGVAADHIGGISAQLHARAARLSPSSPAGPIHHLHRLADAEGALNRILADARVDHAHAHAATGSVLQAAEADASPAADTAIGRREAMARMAAHLRTQHGHIARTRSRAKHLAARFRRLGYARKTASGRPAILAAIRKALDIKGIHDPAARARWARGMDLVARRESNYNAGALNGWDANAARGTPSRGAWQFIAPTFAAYHQPGTSHNIDDLVAQACAFINYARDRYGVAADASNLAVRIQQADPSRSPKGY